MNKVFRNSLIFVFILLCFQAKAFSGNAGHLSGTLLLDDSWDRHVYMSFIENFEKEYSISNDLVVASAELDSLGNFKIGLDQISADWSLLRLHVVKKGGSPNSLVIGGRDENYYFLIARRNSEIQLYNSLGNPIFENVKVEGANHMNTFEYIRKLSNYPNSMDYENSLIEKKFIEDVVFEKLKTLADSCQHPLVSLYALYQTGFEHDYREDPVFYDNYLSKWELEKSTYFDFFRLKFPKAENISTSSNFLFKSIFLFAIIGALVLAGVFMFGKKNKKIKKLSVQERKVFDLVRKGFSNKEISAECNVEVSTVKSHVSSIYSKLKIKSRREAIDLKVK